MAPPLTATLAGPNTEQVLIDFYRPTLDRYGISHDEIRRALVTLDYSVEAWGTQGLPQFADVVKRHVETQLAPLVAERKAAEELAQAKGREQATVIARSMTRIDR